MGPVLADQEQKQNQTCMATMHEQVIRLAKRMSSYMLQANEAV